MHVWYVCNGAATPDLCGDAAWLQMINEIRTRTGARVNLFDDEFNCGERQLQASGCCLMRHDLWQQCHAGREARRTRPVPLASRSAVVLLYLWSARELCSCCCIALQSEHGPQQLARQLHARQCHHCCLPLLARSFGRCAVAALLMMLQASQAADVPASRSSLASAVMCVSNCCYVFCPCPPLRAADHVNRGCAGPAVCCL